MLKREQHAQNTGKKIKIELQKEKGMPNYSKLVNKLSCVNTDKMKYFNTLLGDDVHTCVQLFHFWISETILLLGFMTC